MNGKKRSGFVGNYVIHYSVIELPFDTEPTLLSAKTRGRTWRSTPHTQHSQLTHADVSSLIDRAHPCLSTHNSPTAVPPFLTADVHKPARLDTSMIHRTDGHSTMLIPAIAGSLEVQPPYVRPGFRETSHKWYFTYVGIFLNSIFFYLTRGKNYTSVLRNVQ